MVSCFTMGLYCASQFRFGEAIESYRWINTSIALVLFLSYTLVKLYKIQNDEN